MTQGAFVVRSQSGFLIIPIIGIPGLTAVAFTYYRENLPEFCLENAEMVVAVSGMFTLALIVAAGFLKSRHIEIRGDRLLYRSWLSERTLYAPMISAVTLETEVSGGSDNTSVSHYLTVWSGDEVALKFNSLLWPRDGMGRMLRWLKERIPEVRMDLAVERYMGN